jgi:hypothetical protein
LESRRRCWRWLELMLPAVRARGYRWVTVGELLATCRMRL